MLSLLLALGDFFLVLALALAAVFVRAIDGRGFLASAAVGFAIIFGGGLGWFIIVGTFFALGVAFTWYKYGYKKKLGGAQEKGGERNWPNILANGGVASLFAVGNLFRPGMVFAGLFLGAIGAAAADTVGTELGLLSEKPPRLIVNPARQVPPGTSGAVSLLGFLGAILASMVIGAMALFLGIMGDSLLVIPSCLLGSLAGAIADSVLGATAQRKGYCKVCLRQTEALHHCGEKTTVTGGVPYIENNLVNVAATVVGALVSLGVLALAGI